MGEINELIIESRLKALRDARNIVTRRFKDYPEDSETYKELGFVFIEIDKLIRAVYALKFKQYESKEESK